jgi:ribosomal protein L16/L10AE
VSRHRAALPEAKVWIRVFPHKSVSKKPAETRMGTGKGDVEFWAAVVKPGTILFELDGVTEDAAKRPSTAWRTSCRCASDWSVVVTLDPEAQQATARNKHEQGNHRTPRRRTPRS